MADMPDSGADAAAAATRSASEKVSEYKQAGAKQAKEISGSVHGSSGGGSDHTSKPANPSDITESYGGKKPDTVPSYHTGGVIPKDGIYNLQAGETVVPAKDKKMAGKKHKFSSTKIDLHHDGSATIHHVHESDPALDVHHAVADLDDIHDSMEDHLNPDEDAYEKAEAAEEKVHPGIHEEIAKMGFPEKEY